jgi:hypothetical protein
MNKSQKYLTGVCLVLFVATLLCCPWYNSKDKVNAGFSPFFISPTHFSYGEYHQNANDRIDSARLWIEWIPLGVIYTGLFFMLKKSKNE